jgi:hypothetical protein
MTRPELFVFIALSAGWLAIAGWTFRIARLMGSVPADRTDEGMPPTT